MHPESLSAEHVSRPNQGEQAYQRIRRDILACRLLPGVIVTEPELMAGYGIGKSSCRIALTRLGHENFVVSRPRKGYQIAPVMVKDVEEIFTLRVQLEPLAARLAVGRVSIARLRELEAACRVRHPAPLPDQIDRFMDANKAFHLEIARASGNERLLHTLTGLLDEMSRLVALGFNAQGIKPEIKHDHNAMIAAFEDGDSKKAELIARRHIETFQSMTMEKVYASLSETGAPLPLLAGRFG
ncbi:GntR family transcriptional regulator [Paracandidimonas soli]|uniref:GntR family transcriptional regulator n=1 Tax=Paracandidimonas soli TaxID=1917182 RepID=UPI003340A08A